MSLDDDRLARASRALRHRLHLRQLDVDAPGRSRHFVRDLESGNAGRLRVDDIRDHFSRLGASLRVTAWWNGASLDRLLDEKHAAVIEAGIVELTHYGWRSQSEVTFAEYADRGSIDIFAAHDEARALVVGEAKSAWGSVEETFRTLDMKTRLAPRIAVQRFGFRPVAVATLLIFPEDRTARRVAERYAGTLGATSPARNRQIRAWLRKPSGPMRGLWFLTDVHADGSGRRPRR